MTQSPIERVLEQVKGAKPRADGKNWDARCPAHDDRHASLSVGVTDDGRVLLKCQANCPTDNVVAALGLQMSDLFPPEEEREPQIVALYDYRDEAGVLQYQVVRFDPKRFVQRRPKRRPPRNDRAGDWHWNMQSVQRVLYRLPELLAADPGHPVFLVEGEKDADRLAREGLVSTTNVGGAGKWKRDYNEALRGRKVVLLPDNDEPGREHARTVERSLQGVAASVRTLELKGLPDKGDVSDWLNAGHTVAELLEAVNQQLAQDTFPEPIPASLLRKDDHGARWLWEGYLVRGGITLLSAYWKAGKSTLLAHLLHASADQENFCGKPIASCNVLYVTEEDESLWADRRDELGIADNVRFQCRPFLAKPNRQRWREFLTHLHDVREHWRYDLLVLDTISNLWPIKDENDNAEVQAALMPLHGIGAGLAITMSHHLRKGDGGEATASRGAGALPAFVDTIIELRRFDPSTKKDRRRILTGYGRYKETPDELVIELTEDGKAYSALGSRLEVGRHNLASILEDLLPDEPPGWPLQEILEKWPGDSTPTRSVLLDLLNHGLDQGRYRREGRGRRGAPYTFWLPAPDSNSVPKTYREKTATETLDPPTDPPPPPNGEHRGEEAEF